MVGAPHNFFFFFCPPSPFKRHWLTVKFPHTRSLPTSMYVWGNAAQDVNVLNVPQLSGMWTIPTDFLSHAMAEIFSFLMCFYLFSQPFFFFFFIRMWNANAPAASSWLDVNANNIVCQVPIGVRGFIGSSATSIPRNLYIFIRPCVALCCTSFLFFFLF